ncbi:MAG TPA: aldehyde dehydrogenase family protein [Noviherbaspirillum sp.]|nr:aldehyde dehydrogenase family protein [Noviherbaspirillum sp.]
MSRIHECYIHGEWVAGNAIRQNINPSDMSDLIGIYSDADASMVANAIASASAAKSAMRAMPIQKRATALLQIGNEIIERKQELGRLLAREEGKTIREAIMEVERAGWIFLFFSGEALRCTGELLDSVRPDIGIDIIREPVGVVAIITPWNFPIAIPAWKIAPALAFGNSVIFKPAELTPGCAWELTEIISRAGFPRGAINLLMGEGAKIGPALLESKEVDAITFTGSTPVGLQIASAAALSLKKIQLEMGGKNPLVVLDDAHLPTAIDCAIDGAFFSTGQRCTASSQFIVTEGIYAEFKKELVQRAAALQVGNALSDGTQIGPVVDDRQLQKDLRYVDIAQAEGGKLLVGGTRVQRAEEGFYFLPAIVDETLPHMTINKEEVFGPIASILVVKDYDEALQLANQMMFGLTAGIVTQSLKHATHFKRNAQAGMVMVNVPTAGVDFHVPFGGKKASGWGPKEQGAYARDFYTTIKTAYTKS